MPNEGSLVLIIILILLQGVTGISFGLVISSAIDNEQSANQAALGIFYPNLIISGRPDRTRFGPKKPGFCPTFFHEIKAHCAEKNDQRSVLDVAS